MSLKKKTNILLIVGGSGFFGKSILDAFQRGLLKQWSIEKIIVVSRNANKLTSTNPELINDNVELLDVDITSVDVLPFADYVIHAAASSDASKYTSQSDIEKKNIIQGTLNYCRLATRFHKDSMIVFTSSGAVYGYQPEYVKYLTEDMAFGDIENLDEVKKSYAYAKRDSEFSMQELGRVGLNVSIARCFSFIGKYLPKDQHFAIGNFIADGIAGRDINIKADRKVYRSYMYADDLVRWLMTLAENANPKCPIYNVASDEEVEIKELADIVANIFNVGVQSLENNATHIDRYIPSVGKANNELGLCSDYELNEAIIISAMDGIAHS
jgi:dTDP-glucose 4,6-dehydratase